MSDLTEIGQILYSHYYVPLFSYASGLSGPLFSYASGLRVSKINVVFCSVLFCYYGQDLDWDCYASFSHFFFYRIMTRNLLLSTDSAMAWL